MIKMSLDTWISWTSFVYDAASADLLTAALNESRKTRAHGLNALNYPCTSKTKEIYARTRYSVWLMWNLSTRISVLAVNGVEEGTGK